MQITNFKLIDFLKQDHELISDYMVALRYIKPRKTKRNLYDMKLKNVELVKQKLYSNDDLSLIKIVSKVQKIKEEKVLEMPIIKFFGIVASIKKQLEIIVRAEENGLTPSFIDPRWEIVNGSERMSKFGIYNTLESLSGGDALKYKKYMNMNYSEIFTILLMRKEASELQREMSKIKLKQDV